MRRIIFFIIGFISIYLVSVVVLNLLPERVEEPVPQSPEIQIQQPEETATPSAQEEIIQPDL